MDEPSNLESLETRAFFQFLAEHARSPDAIDARVFHSLARYTKSDFLELSEVVRSENARASIAFLGRDAHERASEIETLHENGHEVVLHGYRHLHCGEISYEIAHENLAKGLDEIEDAAGIRPAGFFAPFKDLSAGTLRAAAELEFDWVLGSPSASVPSGLKVVESVFPHDTRLLGDPETRSTAFEILETRAEPDSRFLFHPNLIEYYDALDEFRDWIAAVGPTTVGGMGDDDVGMLLDCLRPIAVE